MRLNALVVLVAAVSMCAAQTQGRVVLQAASPAYPELPSGGREAGDVKVDVSLAPSGEVMSAAAVSGPEGLRAAAEGAARKWHFESEPESAQEDITFRFRIVSTETRGLSAIFRAPATTVEVVAEGNTTPVAVGDPPVEGAKRTPKKADRSFLGEVPTNVSQSVAQTLRFTENNFLSIAEAMPEEKYGFIPTAGKFDDARSFGEQVKHVACAQFAFFNEFEGKKPPDDCEKGGHNPAKTKAELIKYLNDSFAYSDRVIATLTAKNALDRVDGRYAGPNTKLGISVVSVWHVTDHYGQLVEYLRMNGIVPPMTQQYGLKVR